MISIQIVSNYCAERLGTKVLNTKYPTKEDQIETLEYGFMFILGAVVKGILLVALAALLGVMMPAIILTLTFSSLRVIAGGYHLKTFGKCMIFSISQFIISALIAQHTYQYWSKMNLWGLFSFCLVIGLYIIIRYVPRDTPTNPITEEAEIKKFKRWSFIYLFIWSALITTFLFLDLKLIVISSCFGLILELFSTSEVGYKIYDFGERMGSN